MTRDPKRIPRILAKLGELWAQSPDLRLGQAIVNLVAGNSYTDIGQVFSIEDDLLEATITIQLHTNNLATEPPAFVGSVDSLEAAIKFTCPVNSQECLVREKCTNKCGRHDAPPARVEASTNSGAGWCFSASEESWPVAYDLPSREVAICEAIYCDDLKVGDHVYVGQARLHATNEIVLSLFNDLPDRIHETMDDWGGDEPPDFDCSTEQEAELATALRAVTTEWLDRHDLVPRWYAIDDVEKVEITAEMIAASWRRQGRR